MKSFLLGRIIACLIAHTLASFDETRLILLEEFALRKEHLWVKAKLKATSSQEALKTKSNIWVASLCILIQGHEFWNCGGVGILFEEKK